MEHLKIIRDLEMKKIAPLYLFSGEEPFFIDEITNYIEEHLLDEATKAFCQTVVYGRDVKMDQVLALAKGFPMMGDRQVVLVKEAQDMSEWKKQDDLKAFEAYIAAPTPSTMLVFAFKKPFDKRTKIYKTIEKSGVSFVSDKIKEAKLPDWIASYTQGKGLKISTDASVMLADYLGTDLGKVVNEIGKLAIVLPAGSTISKEIVAENIGISKDYNIWELQKALSKKEVVLANRIINYFEANPKQHPIQMLIPGLYSYFLKLSIYLSLPDKRNAAADMGVNPYALNDYKLAAANFPAVKVERIIGYLREADKRSKGIDSSNHVTSGDLMRELVFKILH